MKDTENTGKFNIFKWIRRLTSKLAIALIRFYQLAISPYKGGPMCNYYPTCSQYAKEAIEMYGCIKGGILAFRRILRCNPVRKGGYDPVPKDFKIFKIK